MFLNSLLKSQLLYWVSYSLITLMDIKIKILVIGAGPAGLSALKALKMLPSDKYEIICIEKQPDWSGQWNYTWRSTTDKYGQHVHSSMYSQLWTNLPKECFQFPDYTFKDHFKKPVPSYLPRDIFRGYFMARFQRQGLRKFILFNRVARNVQYLEKEKQFEVRFTDLATKTDTIGNFQYVVVATGHFSYPYIPQLKNIELFKGKVAHCHQLRQFSQFKDKTVLVLGGSYSAEDVALQCYKYGAQKVVWAYRKLKMKYNQEKLPAQIEMLTGLSHFGENQAYFENGESRRVDAVLMCTGYIHHYPFMEEKLRLSCANPNVLWPQGLYMSVAWEKNPRVFYMGMGSYRLSQIVVDVQGYLVRDIISGKHVVPDLSQRHPNDLEREREMKEAKSGDDLMYSGIRYVKQLMEMTDYPKFDVGQCVWMYQDSVKNREEDLVRYRDVGMYRSIHTGQESCLGKRAWLEMLQVQPTNPKSQNEIKQFFEF